MTRICLNYYHVSLLAQIPLHVAAHPCCIIIVEFHDAVHLLQYELSEIPIYYIIPTGSSPYSIEGLPEGEHTLFVLGRKWGQQATKLFTFKIVSDDPFQVMAEQLPGIDAEGNIRVNLAANRQNVKFQCSLGGNEFTECKSDNNIFS